MPHPVTGLTAKKWRLIHLVAQGLAYKLIAYQMALTPDSLRVCIAHLRIELGMQRFSHGEFVLECQKISACLAS
jgi:DNA-binding CsgD family transcriptional regulator